MTFSRAPWLIIRAAANPATIITISAPLLIIVSEAFFRSNSDETYLRLLRLKEVCGLLDHRTQIYTLIVAFFFFQLQAGGFVLRRMRTTTGTIDLRRQDGVAGWVLLAMIVSAALFFGFMLTGHFMTSEVVSLYSGTDVCRSGNLGGIQPPPVTLITLFRAGTGLAAAVIAYVDLQAG